MSDYETLHDVNNVSNFGGDPVTKLNFKNVLNNLISHFLFQNMCSAGLICIWGMERYIINYTS